MYLVPFPDKKDILDIPGNLVLYDSKAQQAVLNSNTFDILKFKYNVNLCDTENSKKPTIYFVLPRLLFAG